MKFVPSELIFAQMRYERTGLSSGFRWRRKFMPCGGFHAFRLTERFSGSGLSVQCNRVKSINMPNKNPIVKNKNRAMKRWRSVTERLDRLCDSVYGLRVRVED